MVCLWSSRHTCVKCYCETSVHWQKLCVLWCCYATNYPIRGCHPPPTLGFPEIVVRRTLTWSASCDNSSLMWLFSLNLAYNWRPNMASEKKTKCLSTVFNPPSLTVECQDRSQQTPTKHKGETDRLKSWESSFFRFTSSNTPSFSAETRCLLRNWYGFLIWCFF